MSRARPSRRGSRGVTPRIRAARARPCAAGNARKTSSPPRKIYIWIDMHAGETSTKNPRANGGLDAVFCRLLQVALGVTHDFP